MKTIELKTNIVFTATGEKYVIIEQTSTGFQFKPIRFEKGLPTVPRTFAEIKEEFLSGHISIEGFEHTDADNRLVELIMDGYMKEARIAEVEAEMVIINNEKTELQTKSNQQAELISEHEAKLLSNEKTISEQQTTIQEQKDFIQGQKDLMEKQAEQISQLQAELKEQKKSHAQDKKQWEAEEETYKSTIAGLETAIS